MAKNLKATIQVDSVLIHGEAGMGQQKFTKIVVIEFFAINLYHHSHFLAASFDFTTFFTYSFTVKPHYIPGPHGTKMLAVIMRWHY